MKTNLPNGLTALEDNNVIDDVLYNLPILYVSSTDNDTHKTNIEILGSDLKDINKRKEIATKELQRILQEENTRE